jgi:ATP adenylyltransferase
MMANAVEKNGSVVALNDKHPVTPGHLLVIPIRHTEDWFKLTEKERTDADQLLRLLQGRIKG